MMCTHSYGQSYNLELLAAIESSPGESELEHTLSIESTEFI